METTPAIDGKVGAGAVAGAVSLVLVWLINTNLPEVIVPPEIAVALTTIFTFGVSWLVPNSISSGETT